MFKKFAAVLCAFCMMFGVGANAMAATEVPANQVSAIEIQPRYTYADRVEAFLSISGKTAYVDAEAQGKSNVSKIKLTVCLLYTSRCV